LSQHLRPDRLIRPIDIRLRIILFGDKAVHGTRAFGFLRVIDRADIDASVLLEILEDRFRKDLVVTHIDDDGGGVWSVQKTPQGKRKDDKSH
jgi:hypothetical protein